MSSTKIVIIVLVLVGLLFIIFVARGALRDEPEKPPADNRAAKNTKPPDWSKTIKELFSSLKPGLTLKQKVYSSNTEETVPPSDQAFRTATFHRLSGVPVIVYKDETPIEPGSALKDMDDPQRCRLPDFEQRDPDRCAIVALKKGGKLTFACEENRPCKAEVE